MFLIIFDNFCISQDNEYYLCKGDYFENITKSFPDLKTLNKDIIEEILICSLKKEDERQFAKVCKCKQYYIDDDYIKIEYENIAEWINDEYEVGLEKQELIGELLEENKKKLDNLKIIAASQEIEYLAKEKQISTFLECKKTFFGKCKFSIKATF